MQGLSAKKQAGGTLTSWMAQKCLGRPDQSQGRARQWQGMALAGALKEVQQAKVHLLTEFGGLEPALREFAAAGVSDLFISSGDGTVHAIQTLLAEKKIFAVLRASASCPMAPPT